MAYRRRLLSRRDRKRVAAAAVIGLAVIAFAHPHGSGHPGSGAKPVPARPAAVPSDLPGNIALGQRLASADGWGSGQQWDCLFSLWQRESGWSNTADTRVSGLDPPGAALFAYGIAQARPATKYPLAGQPPDLGGSSEASTQISWGLGYIQATYGSPCNAWNHEETQGWY